MNFYELKLKLNFPQLAGAIRRKVDVVALLALNEHEVSEIQDAIDWMWLNTMNDGSRGYAASIDRLKKMLVLHKQDIATLQKYIREAKIEE